MPHAEDRADNQGQLRECSHIPFHHTCRNGSVRHSKPLYLLPRRQVDQLGDERIEGLAIDIALAGGAVAVAFGSSCVLRFVPKRNRLEAPEC